MKRYFGFLIVTVCVLMVGLTGIGEEVDTEIWQLDYYVDEFKLPTNELYIRNRKPIEGTFNNSVVSDAELSVMIMIDEENFAITLYEYGDNRVKNGYSEKVDYSVTLLDDTRQKIYMDGYMSLGQDRIHFNTKDELCILQALKGNRTLSFYIAEKNDPITNYLFTIADTTGIEVFFAKMKEASDEQEYQKAIMQYEAGNYLQAIGIFEELGDYKDSAEWRIKCNAVMLEEYESKLCGIDAESAVDLKPAQLAIVYATSNGGWYHTTVDCSGMTGAKAYTLGDCGAERKRCKKCEAPEFELTLEPCLWSDEHGKYHTTDGCSEFVGKYKLIPLANALSEENLFCTICGAAEYMKR